MPTAPKVSPQNAAYAVAVVGILAGLAGGYFTLSTPAAEKCGTDLAGCSARLELKDEALVSCNATLNLLSGGKP